MRKLLLSFALALCSSSVAAIELAPVPTLGENSAYTYEEVSAPEADSVTLYEVNSTNKEFSYINENGEAVTKEYTIKEAVPHYYNAVIRDGITSASRLNNTAVVDELINHYISQNAGSSSQGGAIFNSGTINKIAGDFIQNSSTAGYPIGGAIYNSGSITSITGDFILNKVSEKGAWGGAIANEAKTQDSYIGTISGNFISNTAESTTENSSRGGAIYNAAGDTYVSRIDSINGNFYNNSAKNLSNSYGNVQGGAITNITANASIGSINGQFVGNNAISENNYTYGGAIANSIGTIDYITGEFIDNYASGRVAEGGAIFNSGTYGGNDTIDGTIHNINGNFFNNYATGLDNAYGGAIANLGKIDSIKGLFYGNYSEGGLAYGGAIHNYGTGTGGGGYSTYAESIDGLIDNINADFINNSALADNQALGGAIDNIGGIKSIRGTFSGNSAVSESQPAGAPYSRIIATTLAMGGAIMNAGSIDTINANFINNSAVASSGQISTRGVVVPPASAMGGAIANTGNIGTKQTTDGKQILDIPAITQANIYDENGNLLNSYYFSYYYTDADIEDIKTYCKENNIALKFDISNLYLILGQDITQEEINQMLADGNIVEGTGTDIKNKLNDYIASEIITKNGIVNSSFINNYASGEVAHGGAIYTSRDLAIKAENGGLSVFKGNYTLSNGKRDDNAIYVQSGKTLTLSAETGGTILMEDKIGGGYSILDYRMGDEEPNITSYNIKVTGDSTGKVIINNNIDLTNIDFDSIKETLPANIQLEKTNLLLGKRDNVLDGNNLQLDSGYFGMINNGAGISALNNLTVNGNTRMGADVDLANKEMDRFTAKVYGSHTGNVVVTNVNLLSDANPDERVTAVYFAEPGLKNNVTNGIGSAPNGGQTSVYSPIYRYDVSYDNVNQYDNKGDGGYFLFTRGSGNSSKDFNPAVLTSPIAAQAAGAATMAETFRYAFQHADTFSPMPLNERTAIIRQNQYALDTSDDSLNGTYFPVDVAERNKGLWIKPYTSFESIDLKNGPTVDTVTYGTLIGGDSKLMQLKNGYTGVLSAYVGYNGSSQSFKGVDASFNGGLIGLTGTVYKGNFFNATTVSAGASLGEATTMYGSEDFTMLLAGIANKSGYNFEFKDGKFIIQPLMQLSYTFVNTFDYTNAAGVKIDVDPTHTITINPGVRFIANLKNNWQPYASIGMVWNLMDETSATANNIKLPEMSVKPYVEYGIGVQKTWNKKNTAFLQAMIRNGGRTGVALTGGYRFAIGKDGSQRDKHILKESPEEQL